MSEKAKGIIKIKFETVKKAATAFESLKPETETLPTSRAHVEVKRRGRNLTLIFEATDTTALRAAINSYLRWVMLIKDACRRVESLDTVLSKKK